MTQFQDYISNGWRLCRIAPGGKGPREIGWNAPGNHVSTFPLGNGAGLLHAFSGTMALDIDNYNVAEAFLAGHGIDLNALMEADDAVQISSGKPGSAKLIYSCPPRAGVACAEYPSTDKDGKPRKAMALDFRCATAGGNTQQDCLPPTMHPGQHRPYEWRLGLCADWHIPPPLPAALEALWDELRAPVAAGEVQPVAPSGAAPERIQKWLNTLDPGMCRGDWVVIGMKLHAEFMGAHEGFLIWQNWSAQSPKWDDEARGAMPGIWKGFRLEGRNLATLAADVREVPAGADEFEAVQPEVQPQSAAPEAAEAMEAAPAYMREIREIMEHYVILQTGGGKPYFLMPGHPEPEIRKAAGLAGVEVGERQLANIFGPYLPPVPQGKQMVRPDPCEVLRSVKWRKTVHRMGFNPGGPDDFTDSDGHTYLNAYKPIAVEPIKPTASQIEPLLWLLRRVLDDRDEPNGGIFSIWLVQLYAFVLQNPGVKVKWAPLLYSAEQGTGKTTLMQTLPSLLFGGQYVKPMVHSVLRERFAGAKFDATWWVALSEMHSDAGKVDARSIANKLKPWITDDTIQIEKKGVDSYDIKNHLQFTACSNHDDALFIEEGSTDRRWLIGEMLGKPITLSEMAMLNPVFGSDFDRDKRAQGWLRHYFMNVDVSGFSPTAPPPDTAAKQRVREQSRSTWEDAVHMAIEQHAPPFHRDLVQPVDITQGLLIGKGVTLAQAKSLLLKCGGFEMPRASFARLICIRNQTQWRAAKQSDMRSHIISGLRPFADVDDGADLL